MSDNKLPHIPYRGIEAFRYVDQPIFFAREKDSLRLLRLVTIHRAVLLFGDSGAGKSSLINAAFVPQIEKQGFLPHRLRVQPRSAAEIVVERISTSENEGEPFLPSIFTTDDSRPNVALSIAQFEAALRKQTEFAASAQNPPESRSKTSPDPELIEASAGSSSNEENILLIFDQFEEFVTLFEEAPRSASDHNSARTIQSAIQDLLLRLIRDDFLPIKLLFVFREDYLAKLSRLFSLIPHLSEHSLRVLSPSIDSLDDIISGPFTHHPGHFPRELNATLRSQLVEGFRERSGNGFINLTEVQIVCLRLWKDENPEAVLTNRKIQGLIEDHLQNALKDLGDLREPAVALLTWMVTPVRTRNIISDDDLLGRVSTENKIREKVAKKALAQLVEKTRLVRKEPRNETYFYFIVSESLIPWISNERERLKAENISEQLRKARRDVVKAYVIGILAAIAFIAIGLFSSLKYHEKAERTHSRLLLVEKKAADKAASVATSDREAFGNLLVANQAMLCLTDTNTMDMALLFATRTIERAYKLSHTPNAHKKFSIPTTSLLILRYFAADTLSNASPNSVLQTSGSGGDLLPLLEQWKQCLPTISSPDNEITITVGKGNRPIVWNNTGQEIGKLSGDLTGRIEKIGCSGSEFAIQFEPSQPKETPKVFVWNISDPVSGQQLEKRQPKIITATIDSVTPNRINVAFPYPNSAFFRIYEDIENQWLAAALINGQFIPSYKSREVPKEFLSLDGNETPDDISSQLVAKALGIIVKSPEDGRSLIKKAATSLGTPNLAKELARREIRIGDYAALAGDKQGAFTAFDKAIAIDPDLGGKGRFDPETEFNNLSSLAAARKIALQEIEDGNKAARSGDKTNALKAYNKAISTDPSLKGKFDPLAAYQQYKAVGDAEKLKAAGDELARRNQLSEAAKDYADAKKLAPGVYPDLKPEDEARRVYLQSIGTASNLAVPAPSLAPGVTGSQ